MDLLGTVSQELDSAFVRLAFRTRRATTRAVTEATIERLEDAARIYEKADREDRLFPCPRPPRRVTERIVRALPDGAVADLKWPSGYCSVSCGYDDWVQRCPATRTAHARWFRHQTPRSALICLHGWGAGTFAFEAQAYRASWLYALGLDVVFATLPFHARRGNSPVGRPLFPSTDPFCSNDGFAQAVYDVRGLIALLRHRGVEQVAVTGMSLGGFTSSLLSTVAPEVDAAIPIIPFASLPHLMWQIGEGTQAREDVIRDGLTFDVFERAYRSTSPLCRSPLLSGDRLLVIAGEHDRVTPLSHALALQQHFGSALEVFRGGHILQTGRRVLFRSLARFLAARAFIPPREQERVAAAAW